MVKWKVPQYIRERRKRKRTRKNKQLRLQGAWRIAKLLGSILSFLALVPVGLSLFPRISVSESGSSALGDPMSLEFAIRNDGLLDLNDVQIRCVFGDVHTGTNMEISGIGFQDSRADHAETLSPGRDMSAHCGDAVPVQMPQAANVVLEVSYRPSFVSWHRTADFRMEGKLSPSGNWSWRRLAN